MSNTAIPSNGQAPVEVPLPIVGRVPPRLWAAVTWQLLLLSLWRSLRGKRLLVTAFLFALPALLCILMHVVPQDELNNQGTPPRWISEAEFGLIFVLFPNFLIPMMALLYASGMIQDEIEEQTLTYILVRPIPRWTIYLAKLTAVILATALMAMAFVNLTFIALFAGRPELWGTIVPGRSLPTSWLFGAAAAIYSACFGCLSLLIKRSLVIGVIYLVSIEGVLGSLDFALRKVTIIYYLRVLFVRQFSHLDAREWNLNPGKVATAAEAWQVLGAAFFVLTALGAILLSNREFRVKTPEGN